LSKPAHVIRIEKFAINFFLLLFSVMNLLPILWMIMSSFKTENEYRVNILAFPREIRLMNYFDVLIGAKLYHYMLNSFINVLVVVPISLFFVFVTGYLLSRYKFFGRNLIYGLFMLGIFLPVHVILVPIYLEFSRLNMLDKRYTLWIPLIAGSLSMSIFIVESFIRTIPRSIEEAAFVDGARFHYILFRIMMPMCTPAL